MTRPADEATKGRARWLTDPRRTRLIRYALAERPLLLLLALLIPADIARHLISPEILRRFIDSALSTGTTISLATLATTFLLLAVVGQGLGVACGYVASRAAWAATNRLRNDLTAHCLRQDPGFYQRHPPGLLVDRLDNDVSQLASVMSGLLLEIIAQFLLAVGILAALFHLDWRLGMVFTPFTVLMLLLLRRLAGRAVPLLTAKRQAGAELLGYLEERLAGTEDITPNGASAHAMTGLQRLIRTQYTVSRQAARKAAAWPVAMQSLSAVSFSLALAVGVWLYLHAGMTLGTVFAGLSYATLLRLPLMHITSRFQDIEDAAVSVRRLNELFDVRSKVVDGEATLAPGRRGITLENVSFSYGRQPALRDVSLRLTPGESLGVIGRTGSGKSTLIRLLFRQYDPDRGAIRLGDVDLRAVTRASLRSRITLATQEVHIVHGSLRDNLTFFDPSVPDERLWSALAEVGLDTWAADLPDGLDTALGGGRLGLSAGQEQLLALARAFLGDPDVVLLDEPSSRLDPHTERLLRDAIGRLIRGRTAVIVAHRVATLREVDRVLLLAEGQVARIEDPTVLLADGDADVEQLTRAGELR